jgi:YD repeat-containing protein
MKNLKKFSVLLLIWATFASCSKDNNNTDPAIVPSPLVTQMVVMYSNLRVVYNNTYDDKKRLATVGTATGVVTYNAGGFEIVRPNGPNDNIITDVNLTEGRISGVLCYYAAERYNSAFSYDSKGRLIKIVQTRTASGQVIGHFSYAYSWDDNDNLVSNTSTDNIGNTYTTTYSGFSADNVNTLRGKNFGFDYLGTADYPSDYVPDNNGGSGYIFPRIYAGKLLPSVIKKLGHTYNVTYHKNARGYIDKIQEIDPADSYYNIITDIAYQ